MNTGHVRIDLHTHSNLSDGTESPAEVMRAAAAAGLDVVALTDHDSISGWGEAAAAAADAGVGFVPGIEVSCRHHGISIHLLGYWPHPESEAFAAMIAATRDARVDRAQEIVTRVAADYPAYVGRRADPRHSVGHRGSARTSPTHSWLAVTSLPGTMPSRRCLRATRATTFRTTRPTSSRRSRPCARAAACRCSRTPARTRAAAWCPTR